MSKGKYSPIWKIPIEDFKNILNASKTMSQFLAAFGLDHKGGNARTANRRINHENLNKDHFTSQYENARLARRVLSTEKYLTKNSSINRGALKRRLISENKLKEVCAICSLASLWNGQKLVLVIDHINGTPDDNRLENLRLICPNCNSQTDTFAGRNKKKNKAINKCSKCNKNKFTHNQFCQKCKVTTMNGSAKHNISSNDQLSAMVWKEPSTHIAKRLGISSCALKKLCKRRGVSTPPRGYWAKMHSNKT